MSSARIATTDDIVALLGILADEFKDGFKALHQRIDALHQRLDDLDQNRHAAEVSA
jgi:hypothetical protein